MEYLKMEPFWAPSEDERLASEAGMAWGPSVGPDGFRFGRERMHQARRQAT